MNPLQNPRIMLRLSLLVLLLGSLSTGALAQTAQLVVMSSICSVTGATGVGSAVLYAADGKDFNRRLLPGDRLPSSPEACIQVPAHCRFKLLYEGRTIEPEPGTKHYIRDILPKETKVSRLSFTSRFFAFVGKCIDETTDEKKMLTNYRENMSLRAGIKGFGTREYAIQVPLLTDGRVSTEFLSFSWNDGEHADPFLFRLYRQRDKMDLMLKKITDPRLQLTRGAVHLEPGESYTWFVTSASDPARQSEPMTFVFDPEGAEKLMADLAEVPEFREGSELEKTLMYAYALEENQYYYDAAAVWEATLGTYTDNRLIRDLAASFYARMNMMPQALATLR
jgi:hypothetical protein